jgi:hypothetical protein
MPRGPPTLQAVRPSHGHGGSIFTGIRVGFRLIPYRNVENRLGELVGSLGRLGVMTIFPLFCGFALLRHLGEDIIPVGVTRGD